MNEIVDESADRAYFTIIPRLVHALADNPYQVMAWIVIKDIAGDHGECYLATEDLALLTKMSVGKFSECRKALLKKGLLEGELRRDPDYPQPVWHLRVPNLWARNSEYVGAYPTLKSRIARARLEKQQSLHQVKPSPGEGGPSPHEKGPSPHEAKKIQKKNQKEKPLPPLRGGQEGGDSGPQGTGAVRVGGLGDRIISGRSAFEEDTGDDAGLDGRAEERADQADEPGGHAPEHGHRPGPAPKAAAAPGPIVHDLDDIADGMEGMGQKKEGLRAETPLQAEACAAFFKREFPNESVKKKFLAMERKYPDDYLKGLIEWAKGKGFRPFVSAVENPDNYQDWLKKNTTPPGGPAIAGGWSSMSDIVFVEDTEE